MSGTELFRQVLGNFATGLTVISLIDEHGPTGFTCQSFMSLSLEPPMVAFAPSVASETWPRIRSAGVACINLLSEGQQDIGAKFATRAPDRFEGVTFNLSPGGMPIIEGALAYLDVGIRDVYPGGDHYLVVATVEDLGVVSDLDPLIYHRSVYRGFGNV